MLDRGFGVFRYGVRDGTPTLCKNRKDVDSRKRTSDVEPEGGDEPLDWRFVLLAGRVLLCVFFVGAEFCCAG